jgi:hypothetical protein
MKKITRVYLIYSNTDYYIGTTTQTLRKRFGIHKSQHKRIPYKCSSSYVFDSVDNINDVNIRELCIFEYKNNSHSFEIENNFICEYRKKYGDKVANNKKCRYYKKNCIICGRMVSYDHYADHKRTRTHRRNINLFTESLQEMNEIISE